VPNESPPSQDVAATFCATLVDEWVRAGVRDARVAPGSRSTPMALALAANPRVRVSVHHDERSAAFAALGVGLATQLPAIVLTTSGTAAAELHAAVVEAHQAHVPLLAVTADRPPELRDVGAPQSIDQQHLFGRAARWFSDPGVPDWSARHAWRSLASRALNEAVGAPPGPVHLNLPFREPLVGQPAALPDGRRGNVPWHGRASPDSAARLVALDRSTRGVVLAGRDAHLQPLRVLGGWPVLADARAGVGGVAHADALLRVPDFADAHRPGIVVQIGEPPASRVVNEWVAASGAPLVVIGAGWIDPARRAAQFAMGIGDVRGTAPRGWRASWQRADAAAAAAIGALTDHGRALSEPGVARDVVAAVPRGGNLVLASSMPVRDVEWYAPRRADIQVFANRGANGIDGVVSTAIGVASRGEPTVALVGDIAFLHDSTALVALAARALDLTIVVVDNDGGGIFSFLPQASQLEPDRFEQLFGTPHGADCAAIARAHGVASTEVTTRAALAQALRSGRGTRVIVVRTDRRENVDVHRRINAAVAAALRGAG
jgi:2-succinyl-5-enolpyruvyl-6-hydroxy-3-cyclohexene-1-carboxylate synthase